MDYTTLELIVADGIAHIILNRPDEKNTMVPAFWRELPEVLQDIDSNPDARVVLISSSGPHFSAGMDLSSLQLLLPAASVEPGRARAVLRDAIVKLQGTFSAIEACRQPVIAAVQGGCIGGGVGLISACDMRYCTSDAFFSIEETNLGVACDIGSLQRLPHILSATLLREWVFTGDRLDASRAREWGLVGAVFDDQPVMISRVMDIATRIAEKSPLALQGCKQSLNYSRDHAMRDSLEQIALWNAAVLQEGEINKALNARKSGIPAAFDSLLPTGSVFSD